MLEERLTPHLRQRNTHPRHILSSEPRTHALPFFAGDPFLYSLHEGPICGGISLDCALRKNPINRVQVRIHWLKYPLRVPSSLNATFFHLLIFFCVNIRNFNLTLTCLPTHSLWVELIWKSPFFLVFYDYLDPRSLDNKAKVTVSVDTWLIVTMLWENHSEYWKDALEQT